MNRQEAFDVMKQGGHITHPILEKYGIGPLSMVGDVVCGKHGEKLEVSWKTQIDSQIFNDGWIACGPKGIPKDDS